MRAVAHGFKPKGKKAPPLAVAKEYVAEDRAKKKRTIAEGY